MRKILTIFVALFLTTAGFVSLGFDTKSADATTNKSIVVDCAMNNPGWIWGTVYLFPGEQLVVDYANCDSDLYTETDNDPVLSTWQQTLSTGAGRMTFSSDGTFVISGTVSSGPNQGSWLNAHSPLAYVYFSVPSNQNELGYIEVKMAGEDVTSLSGKTLLSSPRFEFPFTITSADQFESEAALSACMAYDSTDPENPIVFTETPWEVTTAGDFTLRTISSTPITSYTNYILTPDGRIGMTPLLNMNYLIYEDFDPLNPAEGLLGCGAENEVDGDYLASGEIISSRYASLDIQLDVGNYTIVTVYRYPISLQDWNNSIYWTPVQGQSVNAQIWGPVQSVRQPSPSLATTGYDPNYVFPVLMVIAGMSIYVASRKNKQTRAH